MMNHWTGRSLQQEGPGARLLLSGQSARLWGGDRGTEGLEVGGGRWHGLWEEPSLQRSHKVELLPVLTGEDGCLFVVFHQLVHGVKPPLPDAVDIVHELHLEMFILP